MGKGSSIATRCGVGCRCGLDPELLGLWCRSAATALIRPLAWELPYAPISPLAWEPPYAKGAALKKTKDRSSHCGAMETHLTRNHGVAGSIPGLTQWVKERALP